MSMLRNLLFLVMVFFIQKAQAQQLFLSPEEYIDGNTGKVKVIGNLGDTTISFLESYEGFELIWYDSIMRKLGVSELDFLEHGAEEFRFYTGTDAIYIFYQKKKRKQLELWAAKVIPADKDTIRPLLIDSAELSGIWDKNRFVMHNTQNPNRFAYSFINYDNNTGTLDFSAHLINNSFNSIARVTEEVKDIVYYKALQLLVDNNDGMHIVFGEPAERTERYRNVLIGSQSKEQRKMIYKKLDIAQYNLANLQAIYNEKSNEILLAAIAYIQNDNQLSALARYTYKTNTQQWTANYYTKTFDAPGTNNNNLTNLHLQKILPREDGGCAFILEKAFEELYERNRSIGFISPGLSMASSSYSIYHKDELYVYNTNNIGELVWAAMVPKSQETGDANERFLSFGTLEYPLGAVFLYEDQSNKIDRFITAFLSNTGKLTLRQFQPSNYGDIVENGLMLRNAKQVSANAVVFPILKRGTLSFAKIVF